MTDKLIDAFRCYATAIPVWLALWLGVFLLGKTMQHLGPAVAEFAPLLAALPVIASASREMRSPASIHE